MLTRTSDVARWSIGVALFAITLCFSACTSSQKAPEQPAEVAQKTFSSPDDAAKALVDALKTDNREALLTIFGPQSKDVIYSGDAVADKSSFAAFVSDYNTMHRFRKLSNGNELLITGTDNKTFPIPLTKNAGGQWVFDTAAGKEELLARRIGRNELAAIDVCAAIADAQRYYFSQPHEGGKQYAQKFISDEGKQNGLYWQSPEGQPESPLGPLVAYATGEGLKIKPDSHQPFHGYYFHMLDVQGADAKGGAKNYVVNGKMTGGFGVVAYPARYNDSGIMTFIINQNGIVYQKNLGQSTDQIASAMTEFDPDKTWEPVEQ